MSKENEPLKAEEAVNSTDVETEAETVEAETETTEEQQPAEETKDEAAALREELEAEQNKYLRLLADYDNYKRRVVKDRQEAEKFRSQSLLSDLLPVLDNFERALSVEAKSDEAVSLLKGLEMVRSTLLEAVKREGLEEIKAVGEAFDPHIHQAVMQEKDENAEPGTVLQELQKGYSLKGRVLRPAMVKVNE
ncbi:nucleotide exchange factor GrpE [Planomicrobium sp. CPCC 101110]|uniref:nucleotide exchange factor GrpE n=1 Tax=Planomicrobium sp. CPCC 101110 TaxID=2599619 RepID=UPI0011B44307|nr:nucleotide exchange factor GrpE [Planomicrobium sp. CPCC 101110]TWT26196.1 nucleotide exchange factor GrpE [Planomicrobium sp. CPCC 101110]